MIPAKAKYKALKPKIAKIFDVIIINGSLEIAITAGIESIAKIISVDSIRISVKKRLFMYNLPFSLTKNLCTLFALTEKILETNFTKRFFSGSIFSLP